MTTIWAMTFLLWCEALSLPVRWLLARWPAPPDVRRMLSRVAGPLLFVLPLWLAAHVLGCALDRWFGLAGLACWLGLTAWLTLRSARGGTRIPWAVWMGYESRVDGKGRLREAAIDGVALVLYLGFMAVRSRVPEMTYDIGASAAEKFPNAMLFWSSWFAPRLPPQDFWYAGKTLVYYYWGHFYWAWVTRMGGFPAELAINLAMIEMVTLVWMGAYLLARAARLKPAAAAGAALCAAWAGSPDGVTQAINLWKSSAAGTFNLAGYNFWHATRPTDNFINEFPSFSAILGDFHSHHLALPWLTAWIALTLAGRRWCGSGRAEQNLTGPPEGGTPEPSRWYGWVGRARSGPLAEFPILWLALWVALAAAPVLTNLWNMPMIAFGIGFWLLASLRRGGWRPFFRRLILAVSLGVVLLIGMRILRGNAPLPLPTDPHQSFWQRLPIRVLPPSLRSSLWILFTLWGFPLLILPLAAALAAARGARRGSGLARLTALLVGAVLVVGFSPWLHWRWPGGTAWVWAGIICWIVALMIGRRPWLSQGVGLMLIAGCLVLAGLELFYVRDRFDYPGSTYVRYNSYFKFAYPIWPVVWVGGWAAAVRLWHWRAWRPLAWSLRAVLLLLLVISFTYTVCTIPARLTMARYGDDPKGTPPSLDAIHFVAYRPETKVEAPLLEWIRRNVPPGEAVAEAPGTCYCYGGRVASLTGHPVPMGWIHHEQQWHGDSGFTELEQRKEAVDQFYKAPNPEEMRKRALALGVHWALFGICEKKCYQPMVLANLKKAAGQAAAYPAGQPEVYLFNFQSTPGN